MPLTVEQKNRIRDELGPCLPALHRAAPPERAMLIRRTLERVGAQPTWDEWDACIEELFGDDTRAVCSAALRP